MISVVEWYYFKKAFVKPRGSERKVILIRRLLPVILVFSTYACYHEPDIIDQLNPICFDTQVLPIIQTSCGISGCHDGSAEEFLAADYTSIMKAVVPGDPRGSTLYRVITANGEEDMMPPDRPLTQEQRTIIHVWIAQGAENNNCGNGNPGGGTGSVDSICFVQHILPLFISNCSMTGCHDGLSQDEGEQLFALNSYASIIQHADPYNPGESPVYKVLTASGEDLMPPPPRLPLTSQQQEMMRTWIADGALNSDCPDASCDTTGTIGFTAQVKPILDNYCVSCHNASLSSGGINLDGYSQVKIQAETLRNGTPILVGTIRQLSGFVAMPPSTNLDACSIRKVELWIEQGILNN